MASTYILIHGAGHGGWCWKNVVPLLEEGGHRVFAPDLPGHGEDHTPLERISFQKYVDCITNLVDASPDPVILVAHSLGGMTATQVVENRWNKIKQVIYLTALIPGNGQATVDVLSESPIPPWAIEFGEGTMKLSPETAPELFYHDCPVDAIGLAQQLLCPEPLAPMTEKVVLSSHFNAVPRAYIECMLDRAIPPASQEKIYTAAHCDVVFLLESSHSPFFSMPEELAKLLLTFAPTKDEVGVSK